MNIVEKMIINKLELYREQANRDRFILPLEQDIKLFLIHQVQFLKMLPETRLLTFQTDWAQLVQV